MREVYGTRIFQALYLKLGIAMDEFKIKGYFIDENRCENLVTVTKM